MLTDTATDESQELHEHLARVGAKMIKAGGVVSVSLSGQVTVGEEVISFSLVPATGTVAKRAKWNKFSEAERLSLVQSRTQPQVLARAHEEVREFVRSAQALAREKGVDCARFWGGLIAPTELASRRFKIVEARIEAAGERLREEASAARTKATVSLSLYPESFVQAASMPRKFIAVLGPTNSGKTHRAMQALIQARSGAYLAPLRLLALENYERLQEAGVAVSLLTGEERRMTEGATHVASTIEMANFRQSVDVAVIDEIQMLEDRERGAAWTAAVCGMPAAEIYLVGALSARAAIESLVKRLGCTLEVHTLERKSPLRVEDKPIGALRNLRKGDALIAFSRRNVLAWGQQLQTAGFSVAMIYGSLSPEVRRAQAQRFREGEVDILVATDAVGMGLNMPIRRIVFTTAMKFDGIDEDLIPAWLAQQIGGRAGRFGLHEEGFVAGWETRTHRQIQQLMRSALDPQPTRGFWVAPSLEQLCQIRVATGEDRLETLLTRFTQHIDVHDEFFLPGDLTEQKHRARWLDQLPLALEHRFLFASVPIVSKSPLQMQAWESWARATAAGKKTKLTLEILSATSGPLLELEDACKKYSAYAWLAYRLPEYFPDGEAAVDLARHTAKRIDSLLQAQNAHIKSRNKAGSTRQK